MKKTTMYYIDRVRALTDNMRRAAAFILAIALAGCGQPEPPAASMAELYPWDGERSATTARGIAYRLASHDPALIHATGREIDRAWQAMQECTGIHIDPDRVLMIDLRADLPAGVAGFVYWIDAYAYARVLPGAWPSVRHEMIHFLLYLAGEPAAANSAHRSAAFDCE